MRPPSNWTRAGRRRSGRTPMSSASGGRAYFALFKTTQPRARAIRALPEPWPDLLDDCCDQEIGSRPKDFSIVLERLKGIQSPARRRIVPPPSRTRPISGPVSTSPVPAVIAPAAKPTPKAAPSPRFTNFLGMTMVRIEPGEFLMGSTKAQIDKLLKQFPDAKSEWFDARAAAASGQDHAAVLPGGASGHGGAVPSVRRGQWLQDRSREDGRGVMAGTERNGSSTPRRTGGTRDSPRGTTIRSSA